METILIALLLGLIFGAIVSFRLFNKPVKKSRFKRPLRRARLSTYDFPEGWDLALKENLPLYSLLEKSSLLRTQEELKWALDEIQIIGLGDHKIPIKQQLLIFAPFVLMDWSHSTKSTQRIKRFLILDATNRDDFSPMSDSSEMILKWSPSLNRVCVDEESGPSVFAHSNAKETKVLRQIFGGPLVRLTPPTSLFQHYYDIFRTPMLQAAHERTQECLQEDFYISSDDVRDTIAWKILELMCFNPQEVKKALPKTFQGLLHFYQFQN